MYISNFQSAYAREIQPKVEQINSGINDEIDIVKKCDSLMATYLRYLKNTEFGSKEYEGLIKALNTFGEEKNAAIARISALGKDLRDLVNSGARLNAI
ncbi:MAG: hypothetical protein PVI40_05160 [Chlamydiota bacterium]|jgi:hypothetical protein